MGGVKRLSKRFRPRLRTRGKWGWPHRIVLIAIPAVLILLVGGFLYRLGDAPPGEVCSPADQLLTAGRATEARTIIDALLADESMSSDAVLGTASDPSDKHCSAEVAVRLADLECQQGDALLAVGRTEDAAKLFASVVTDPAAYRMTEAVEQRPVDCATEGLARTETTTTTTTPSPPEPSLESTSGLLATMTVDLTSRSDWSFECESSGVEVTGSIDGQDPLIGTASREAGDLICDQDRITVEIEQTDRLATKSSDDNGSGNTTSTTATVAADQKPEIETDIYEDESTAGLRRTPTSVPQRVDRGLEELIAWLGHPINLDPIDLDKWLWAFLGLIALVALLWLMRRYRAAYDIGYVEVGEFHEAAEAPKGGGPLAAATLHDGLRLLETTSSTGPVLWNERSPTAVADVATIVTEISSEPGKVLTAVAKATSWRPRIFVEGTVLDAGLTTRMAGGGPELAELEHYHNRVTPALPDKVSQNAAYAAGTIAWAAEARMLNARHTLTRRRVPTRFDSPEAAGLYAVARLGLERS